MLDRLRFFLYRHLVSFFLWVSFKQQKVHPLKKPTPESIEIAPYGQRFPKLPLPGLYDPKTFSSEDYAKPRVRGMKTTTLLFAFLRWLAPKTAPPVPDNERDLLKIVYPFWFRKAWPVAPKTPPVLATHGCDVLAEIAVSGPFGSYLRKEGDQYVLDLSWMLAYETHAGLEKPGGRAIFALRDGKLCTVAIERPEGRIEVDSPAYPNARAAMLAGMNEDLTTFRHNISTHLASLTPWAAATMNKLNPDHPLRRLLHAAFDTVLVGNHEVAQFQLDGPDGFSAHIFSHDAPVIARMASDYLQRFDFWNFEPSTHFQRAGTSITPFAYAYRDNVMRIWPVTLEFTTDYLRLYYSDDAALRADAEVEAWLTELDRLLTNGIKRPAGGITREWLARLTATLLHHSSVEHDFLNNVSWDYSTLSWIIPTAVPMNQRKAFDLVATLIGTWKPYNMLLTSDIPELALEVRGRQLMQRWIDRLKGIQREMTTQPPRADWSYPAKWNPSISD